MEHIKIKAITEADFDEVVTAAGGTRIPEDSSADYLLNEAVIELKFVEEEGFEKEARRRKVADIFRNQQPNVPVVVIDAETLNHDASRDYYNVVAGPIKTHVKKAASQLDATRLRINPQLIRVMVLMNVGYTALSIEEFKSISLKCVHNDTRKIDWLVCGGIYLHSDKFDFYTIAPLEGIAIDVTKPFQSLALLQDGWGKLLNKIMHPANMMPFSSSTGKMPVLDLMFDLDGVRYVKAAPEMPKSSFWPSGSAPRENTSGITECPHVAVTFPALSEKNWKRFRKDLQDGYRLQGTYRNWLDLQSREDRIHNNKLEPLVPIPIEYDRFKSWIKKSRRNWMFSDLCSFAVEEFQNKSWEVFEHIIHDGDEHVVPLEYIRLTVQEIGSDKANDMCSIMFVSHVLGFEREEVIIENERAFYEYGVAIAGAYAVKRGVDRIIHKKIVR